ncbi:MAG: DNA-processing protein DprA, partial [Candidatus Falkowbacteria bacterium]|nr:DNA-processing protein DprA [Candidatus Falkowbacteria bacterium]
AGIEEKIALEFKAFKNNFDLDFFIKKYEEEDIQTVTLDQKEYPSLLKEIYDPPPILFYKGSIECLSKPTLSVVGSRKFTSYGRQVTEDIVYSLAKNNLVIVSGLALGIDALAHFATLNANGITVAVLGSGVNNSSIYPVTNLKLSKRIIETGGAVISEFPFGTPGFRQNFPQRNRVIAGLSSGTLVIEGHEKSGSLITARCALESGREIFAIPGSIYSFSSAGTNKLIH